VLAVARSKKNPVKASMKEALKAMVDDEESNVLIKNEAADPMELTKEVQAMSTESLESGPNHLMGTQGESHQEQ
jgi:hypothetical protein